MRLSVKALGLLLVCASLQHQANADSKVFDQCLAKIQDSSVEEIPSGVVDNSGRAVSIPMSPACAPDKPYCNATAITHTLCDSQCIPGQEPFQWSVFSQQFGAWLLPWLALVSQLPFGAKHRVDNLMSVVLAIGSPALAAYSLILTVLNSTWLARRFSGIRYPNADLAVKALSSLQQSPLKVTTEHGLLACLVVLPHNDEWWDELVHWLDYTHTWSISAVTNLLWVIIAYVFTVANAFTTIDEDIKSQGQAVGSLWMWLPTVVVGWLQISPKCDWERLGKAMKRVDSRAYVAGPNGGVANVSGLPGYLRALSFHKDDRHPLFDDQQCSAPIYNYSRVFCWAQEAEKVAQVYDVASDNASRHIPVSYTSKEWVYSESRLASVVHPANREGSLQEIQAYCHSYTTYGASVSPWGHAVWMRIVTASVVALALQWATTGSAVIISWNTPTKGLGCRSGTYLIYGLLSTITWLVMFLSSILTHYASLPTYSPTSPSALRLCAELDSSGSARASASSRFPSSDADMPSSLPSSLPRTAAAFVALTLRRIGKLLAILNTIWVLAGSIFQFTNFFNNCWCNSNVISLGLIKAYTVMDLTPGDIGPLKEAWAGGVIMGTVSAAAFWIFVNVYINPPMPGD